MPEFKTVRITCKDGDVYVFDAETGRKIPVMEVDFHADKDSFPTVTIKTLLQDVDVVTGATIFSLCPECGREAEDRRSDSQQSPSPSKDH